METSRWAEAEAERLIGPLGRRWMHVCGVVRQVTQVAEALLIDPDPLVAAAWLHDVGYAPAVSRTGFHPLDGARHLRSRSVDERVVSLVAHHSTAAYEAREQGLDVVLAEEFALPEVVLHHALTYCDMTVGPDGEPMSLEQRIQDVFDRYPIQSAVHRAMRAAAPELRTIVALVEGRLATQSQYGVGSPAR